MDIKIKLFGKRYRLKQFKIAWWLYMIFKTLYNLAICFTIFTIIIIFILMFG